MSDIIDKAYLVARHETREEILAMLRLIDNVSKNRPDMESVYISSSDLRWLCKHKEPGSIGDNIAIKISENRHEQ